MGPKWLEQAYLLHVWGFHEAKLGIDDIIGYVDEVERMVKETEKALTH
nr:PaREP1 family protein [Vulcanisaeta sp. JCM 16159]